MVLFENIAAGKKRPLESWSAVKCTEFQCTTGRNAVSKLSVSPVDGVFCDDV